MPKRHSKIPFLILSWLLLLLAFGTPGHSEEPKSNVRHFLYVAAPGIRDDLQFGGACILVFDMDQGFAFVKRIETPAGSAPSQGPRKIINASRLSQIRREPAFRL